MDVYKSQTISDPLVKQNQEELGNRVKIRQLPGKLAIYTDSSLKQTKNLNCLSIFEKACQNVLNWVLEENIANIHNWIIGIQNKLWKSNMQILKCAPPILHSKYPATKTAYPRS